MPSRNTKHARKRGYSDIRQMNRENGKLKNFGVKTGRAVDSEAERAKSGHKPHEPKGDNSHWKDTPYEQRIRREFFRPQLNQKY